MDVRYTVYRQEFYLPSTDGVHRLHCICWVPDGEIRAVFQIVHGMCEHIARYDEFGRYLAQRGVLVVGHSHLGHGLTAQNEDELGWFGEPDGNALLIEDIHKLREELQRPELPFYILGHCMGSFLTRQYLGVHGEGLSGAVIMGTADIPVPVLKMGQFICRMIALVKGWHHRSALVSAMVTDGYQRKYGLGWLSKNEDSNRAYEEDSRCGFRFTLNGFYNLFLGLERASRTEAAGQLPTDYPLLFTAGAEDPVGACGKGVRAVYSRYRRLGAKSRIRLYPGDRHEILNESDREQVFEDIYNWMNLK